MTDTANTLAYRGPYTVGRIGDNDGAIMRHNDGAMIVMGRDEYGDRAPVLLIPMRARPKRGDAWRTTDPDQEAFAAVVVQVMNKAYAEACGMRDVILGPPTWTARTGVGHVEFDTEAAFHAQVLALDPLQSVEG